jgi:flavin reductase (DIM6/NTAB) family NADH-FMN oxidoreductase RutF/DNA-binding GntR family transcriptional regulator
LRNLVVETSTPGRRVPVLTRREAGAIVHPTWQPGTCPAEAAGRLRFGPMRGGVVGTVDLAVPPDFDAAAFRRVIGSFMSGVVVITAADGDVPHGMTVSAVSSLSMDPPMLLACLNTASRTQEVVARTGVFAVNILAHDQGELAARFARSGLPDKFDGVGYARGRTGVPLLDGALAVVECKVAEVVTGGTHRVFLGRVLHAEATEGSPLAYFRGRFGKLEIDGDTEAYDRLRRMVLTRELPPDTVLDVDALANQINTAASSVYYALTRLAGDNLVLRDPDRGHVVKRVDAAAADDAHDGKLAIELGSAEMTVGRLTEAQLDEFAQLAELTARHLSGGHFTDVAGYIEANEAFHTYPIAAAGITSLLEAYRRLSLPDLMSRTLSADAVVSDQLIEDHRQLVDAYRRGDLAEVKHIVVRHNELGKATQRAAIERAGGQL